MAKVTAPFYAARLSMADAPVALPVPVAGVSFRQIANTYGAPRGSTRKHEGLDIFAKRGTPVLSATEGMVTRVGTNRLGGNVVWVLGPGGQRHYYAHLDTQADLSAGDRVAAGTELGTVGDTGNARGTPPHLHYGVYATGGAINPYPLLKEGAK
nr:M23 family metallopeptidase [Achromobacter aestuarii]